MGTGDTNAAQTYKMPASISLYSEEEKATAINNAVGYPDPLRAQGTHSPHFFVPLSFSGNCPWLQGTAGPRSCSPYWRPPASVVYMELQKLSPPGSQLRITAKGHPSSRCLWSLGLPHGGSASSSPLSCFPCSLTGAVSESNAG